MRNVTTVVTENVRQWLHSACRKHGIRVRYSDESLGVLLHTSATSALRRVALSLPLETDTIHQDLQEYTYHHYSSMNQDRQRNDVFRKAIHAATFQGKTAPTQWLEIGPGAYGTLTRMACDASPRNTVHAIEANRNSVDSLNRIMADHIRRNRLILHHGLAGHVKLLPPDTNIDVLLAEILGHVASSEGYVAILRACVEGGYLFTNTCVTIPKTFGTRFVPVDLTKEQGLLLDKLGPSLAFYRNLPFDKLALSTHHGIFEEYDVSQLLRQPQTTPAIFRDDATITTTGTLHGLALYIVFGNPDLPRDQGTSTSNRDLPRASTNWLNVLVPLSQPLPVDKGDVVTCTTTCHVHLTAPHYVLDMVVTRGNETLRREPPTRFSYGDVVGTEFEK